MKREKRESEQKMTFPTDNASQKKVSDPVLRAMKILLVIDFIILTFITVMAFKAYGEYVTAYEGLCIREGPGTDTDVIEVLGFGEEVYGEIEAGWMRLEDGRGYVNADWVSARDPYDVMEFLEECYSFVTDIDEKNNSGYSIRDLLSERGTEELKKRMK